MTCGGRATSRDERTTKRSTADQGSLSWALDANVPRRPGATGQEQPSPIDGQTAPGRARPRMVEDRLLATACAYPSKDQSCRRGSLALEQARHRSGLTPTRRLAT